MLPANDQPEIRRLFREYLDSRLRVYQKLPDLKAADQQLQQALFLPSANRGLRPADGFARALYPVLYGSPLHWKNPTLGGILWNLLTWSTRCEVMPVAR